MAKTSDLQIQVDNVEGMEVLHSVNDLMHHLTGLVFW